MKGSIDKAFFLTTLGLVLFGLIMVFSSSSFYAEKLTGSSWFFFWRHFIRVIVGVAAMLVMSKFDYNKLRPYAIPLLFISYILLMIVLIPGVSRANDATAARRWISLGFINLQPSEIAKFAIILYLADSLDRKKNVLMNFSKGLLSYILLIGPVLFLILMEPDYGYMMVTTMLVAALLFVGGVNITHLASAGVVFAGGAVAAVLAEPYRFQRILTFFNPELDPQGAGWQIMQSLIAVGSGGFFGNGLGSSRQKYFYLPEAHTDFIFSIISEELGFIFTLLLIGVFVYWLYRGFMIARASEDNFTKLLALGLVLNIGVNIIINIGICLSLLPTTGIPLPFISYGGSALVTNLASVGIIISISKRNKLYYFRSMRFLR